ncbi:hypothetical protein EGT74_00860 [Chitinophaga lutea]|uniref:Phosphoribosylpyrophosphate synthetase n=1 Tax=Chitinophaga lutea TaxID=2488634 RepID=A0A3N4Q3U5_9BACT|nr:hypothetical protein [Chitinophaga lutea]RPE12141.1 hypothetical protein EGT74_00860 [Chitinophaga lutea]
MQTTPGGMTTLSGVMTVLKERGYDTEFRLLEDGRVQNAGDEDAPKFEANALKIIRTYRFEGDSNPSDSAVLYLLEHTSGQIGYIINAYGAYSDYEGDQFDDFIRKMPVEERDFE